MHNLETLAHRFQFGFADYWHFKVSFPTFLIFSSTVTFAQPPLIEIPTVLTITEAGGVKAESRRLKIPPRPGPKADDKLIDLAIKLDQLDRELLLKRVGNELSAEQLGALIGARNIAVDELVSGRDILLGTAAGTFPGTSSKTIINFIDAIRKGLNESKGRDIVTTTITYSGVSKMDLAIEYLTFEAWNKKVDAWSTYTTSMSMRVGTYMFRVTDPINSTNCSEPVPILSQPTIRGICARFAP